MMLVVALLCVLTWSWLSLSVDGRKPSSLHVCAYVAGPVLCLLEVQSGAILLPGVHGGTYVRMLVWNWTPCVSGVYVWECGQGQR